jgi:hypothetical protein
VPTNYPGKEKDECKVVQEVTQIDTYNLGVGSGTHSFQTGKIIMGLE